MHAIQLDILKRITLCPEARYSDLKSDDIDGNLFMYHLNQLMGEGYIQKDKRTKKYSLTEEGKRFISLLSTKSGEIRKQPQIVVMLDCKNELGQQLLFKWHREPNTNLVSLPHGKLHFGVSPKEMATRELKEKCNLEGNITYKGDIYVTIWSKKEIFNHLLCHIFHVSNVTGDLHSNTSNGEAFWGNIEDFAEAELLPGTWEILGALKSKEPEALFTEIETVL